MVQYIVPLSSLLLSFLATLACLRFIFSRQGLFWIIPVVVSVLLTMSNGFNIFLPAVSLLPLENRDYRIFTRRKKKKTMNSYYQPEIGEYHNDTGSLDE